MLSIPHEMSFIPNLLRIYFNHVKNNTGIHLGMDFEEYSFIKEEMCDEGYEEGGCCTVGGFVRCNFARTFAGYPICQKAHGAHGEHKTGDEL